MSLKVLEGYLPRFFDGAYNIYKNKLNGLKVNRNLLKPEVSQDIKDILSKNMTREIEFYNFCQQRLLQQFDAIRPQWQMKIGITNSTTWYNQFLDIFDWFYLPFNLRLKNTYNEMIPFMVSFNFYPYIFDERNCKKQVRKVKIELCCATSADRWW